VAAVGGGDASLLGARVFSGREKTSLFRGRPPRRSYHRLIPEFPLGAFVLFVVSLLWGSLRHAETPPAARLVLDACAEATSA
jgi:hypothetical protein